MTEMTVEERLDDWIGDMLERGFERRDLAAALALKLMALEEQERRRPKFKDPAIVAVFKDEPSENRP
jgi:hypothetical protein